MTDRLVASKRNAMALHDPMFDRCRPGLPDHAGIDIFRFDVKIVEHRNVPQAVPEKSARGNGIS